MKMIRDTKFISRCIFTMVLIIMISHGTTGGHIWKQFVGGHNWNETRIIFPDMTEYPRNPRRPSTTTPRNDVRQCEAYCPNSGQYNPVCGTNSLTYQNMGQLQCAIGCGVDVALSHMSPCSTNGPSTTTTVTPFPTTTRRNEGVEECIRNCPSTPEYNPVCGTNRVTYHNEGKLRCAKYCGVDVELWRRAPCPMDPVTTTTITPTTRRREEVDQCIASCPTTPEYNPVCGTDDKTYDNIGKLHCAQWCGVDVAVQNPGRCSFIPNKIQFLSLYR